MIGSEGSEQLALGWREWVTFPDWEIAYIKAKIDSGARTSALHAVRLEWFERGGQPWVRFVTFPWQATTEDPTTIEARVIATREIKSSSGDIELRPVVRAQIVLAGIHRTIEITLTDRSDMRFRMLIGREALRENYIIDTGSSYVAGRPPKAIRRRNRGKGSPDDGPTGKGSPDDGPTGEDSTAQPPTDTAGSNPETPS